MYNPFKDLSSFSSFGLVILGKGTATDEKGCTESNGFRKNTQFYK